MGTCNWHVGGLVLWDVVFLLLHFISSKTLGPRHHLPSLYCRHLIPDAPCETVLGKVLLCLYNDSYQVLHHRGHTSHIIDLCYAWCLQWVFCVVMVRHIGGLLLHPIALFWAFLTFLLVETTMMISLDNLGAWHRRIALGVSPITSYKLLWIIGF